MPIDRPLLSSASILLPSLLAAAVGLACIAQPAAPPVQPPAQPPVQPPVQPPTPPPAPAADPAADPAAEPGTPEEPKKEEKPKWNVDKPPYPTFEQTIDVDEGTWISLDVSPDGSTIAFDLLGDLYTIPLAGGEATKLTGGLAWDMQPRFSPDGKLIAFTSDRTGDGDKGGDNIWVMNADGSSPRQITKESYRLFNGPAWSPDGQFIVARKHFTSRRSLGSGEMWMFHVSGSSSGGLQLTTKRTDQKDVNEPIFSPDGKYLYYSEDVTPGGSFEYNKDSNGEIYAVQRLDLEKGETQEFIGGPGGACRPTPSPDGKTIAFVKRVRAKSVLHLYDVESGAVTPIYDDLERDMMESWAIHGVYPAFDWTPDGKSIVFWSRGKIRRLDLASKQTSVIPFHVADTRTVSKAVRSPIDPAPAEVETKMIRWPQVTPDGKRVVFQALGHIYVRDLPETGLATAAPKRLTSDKEFEYFPALSRDGRFVVYVAWDDENLASIRVVPIGGGASRTITTQPGHYADPIFTPDGKQIVFGKISGGYLTSPLWSRDTGVYRVDLEGGDPVLVTKRGTRPRFGASNERLFLTDYAFDKDADNAKLISMKLDGTEERTHYKSTWATEYEVSPDGKWIAFVERFNVYIAPFIDTGRTIDVGPDTKALPIAKATKEAGTYIHFGSGSDRLYWTLGPELFTRTLTDCFAYLDGAPEKLPELPAAGINIGFTVPQYVPNGTVAFVGAKVLTMRNDGQEIIDDGVVIVEGNRIKAVGPRASTPIPGGAFEVDCAGMTITPGFIDCHAHGPHGTNESIPQQNWGQYSNLAFGITTIHDPSNDTSTVFAASEMQRAGMIVSPRVFSTGTILYGATGSYKAEINSLEDALFHLKRMKAVGAFSVKSYNQPRRDQRQQVIEAAHELNMLVVPEGGSTFMHNLTMIADGHTGIEHTFPVEIVYKDVLQFWKDTEVGYTPTLVVGYGGLSGEYYWYEHDDVWAQPKVAAFTPRSVIDPRSRRRQKTPLEEYNQFLIARICKQQVDNGGTVQIGGHGQLVGICSQWEMWMMVQGGMSPLEALRSGTLHGARYLGMDAQLGTIEPGKLADIIVIEKDPLADIRNTQTVKYTMVNGRLLDANTLDEIGNAPRKRAPFFFETAGSPDRMTLWSGGCAGCGLVGAGCQPADSIRTVPWGYH